MTVTAHPFRLRLARLHQATAAGCALLVWLLGLLAVSPGLHAALHSDADHADHTCAVTLFSHGADEMLDAGAITVAPALLVSGDVVAASVAPVRADCRRLPPACGPPVS